MAEAFSIADGHDWREPPTRYAPMVIGLTPAPFTAESGLRLMPETTLAKAPPLDTIVVPGGPGLREPETNAAVASWLKTRAASTRRIVSVCTGLYGLAASGLLDGRRATTHWLHAADAAQPLSAVKIEPDAIFIKDGKFYTSAGMTAAIDLALALIEEDHGAALALATARQLVVYMKRAGGQLQYSEPLRFQTRAGDRFIDLVSRVAGDLGADWSVEAMAAETGLSARQFTRKFKSAFALTPAVLSRHAAPRRRTPAPCHLHRQHRAHRPCGRFQKRRRLPPRLRAPLRCRAGRLSQPFHRGPIGRPFEGPDE